MVKFKVGKGDRTRFWEDTWVGDVPLALRFPLLYKVSNAHNETIASLRWEENFIRRGRFSWDLKFIINLNERESEQFQIWLSYWIKFFIAEEDRRSRTLEGSESFTCKSIFRRLCVKEDDRPFPPFSLIWKSLVPSKVKMFLWTLARIRVSKNKVLQQKQRQPHLFISPDWCIFCKKSNETLDHSFLHCDFVTFLWSQLLREFDLS